MTDGRTTVADMRNVEPSEYAPMLDTVLRTRDKASATAHKLRTMSDMLSQSDGPLDLPAEGVDGLACILMEAESAIEDLLAAARK